MKICGIKLTHDAAVAVIEDGKLLFSVEVEKVNNNPRYSAMNNLDFISDTLADFGLTMLDIDHFAIDGWKGNFAKGFPVAGYNDFSDNRPLLHASQFVADDFYYSSYPHIASHISGSYAMSNYTGQAYSIIWDGGTNPRVHLIDPAANSIQYVDSLFEFYGTIYLVMGLFFGPYKNPDAMVSVDDAGWLANLKKYGSYGIAGKLMSYIALGTVSEHLVGWMFNNYKRFAIGCDSLEHDEFSAEKFNFTFMLAIQKYVGGELNDADVLASIHTFLERLLVRRACEIIPAGSNLIFTGGSALNIKWNSALRETGHFKDVFVQPVPNDCGCAIGVAVCEMIRLTGEWKLDWDVYSGAKLKKSGIIDGWHSSYCPVSELAWHLQRNQGQPIIVINGDAEIGPRALGHRSILCAATLSSTKDLLNIVKNREMFRPVAPICLEQYAPEIFAPGTPDPYMLFDHFVKSEWIDVIPAIVHLDGTARLQTVSSDGSEFVFELLTEYHKLSGIPLLCNTSANYNGCGFFPDVKSAMDWGMIDLIWSDGLLYERD